MRAPHPYPRARRPAAPNGASTEIELKSVTLWTRDDEGVAQFTLGDPLIPSSQWLSGQIRCNAKNMKSNAMFQLWLLRKLQSLIEHEMNRLAVVYGSSADNID
jgi:hypothetical protein